MRTEHDQLPFTALVVSRAAAILAPDVEVPRLFATALAHAQSYGNVFEEGRTHLAFGRRLAALRPSEAVDELQKSHECFQLVGATPWAERAADELEAAGRARPPRKSPLTQLLTPHELEVVELAMTGATTREIAMELFVSPKTVEKSSHQLLSEARRPIQDAARARSQSIVCPTALNERHRTRSSVAGGCGIDRRSAHVAAPCRQCPVHVGFAPEQCEPRRCT